MIIFVVSYFIYLTVAMVGITLGYHRYFSHKSFKASHTTEIIMLYCGLLCGCRSPLTWAAVHRMHHAYADTDQDPHSPLLMPKWKVLFSLYQVKSIPKRFVKDLIKNPRVMFFHKYGVYVYGIHVMVLFLLFGVNTIIAHIVIYLLAYIGYGVLNTFGHDANGPVNRLWINLLAPCEGNHDDHHQTNYTKAE
jgi:fatty-acid desaturase